MLSRKRGAGGWRAGQWLGLVALAVALALSVKTTWYATEHFLDGDASSELTLAWHLFGTRQLLSDDWFYSTELRVANTQLVYAPLFGLTRDWHMVRFAGAMIWQLLVVASFGVLAASAGMSLGAFGTGGALLLLPVSVSYGRIVLYHCYYAPHIAIGFLLVGLYLSAIQGSGRGKPGWWARFAALMLLSFLSGLGGVRQMVITQLPLLLIVLVGTMRKAVARPLLDALCEDRKPLALAAGVCAAFLPGYAINAFVFPSMYSFKSYQGMMFDLSNLERLDELIYGFLHQFGFRRQVPVFSIVGIASAFGLLAAAYLARRAYACLREARADEALPRRVAADFFPAALLVTVGASLVTAEANAYARHLIPAAVWAIPMLCVQLERHASSLRKARLPFVCALLTACVLMGNGLVNAGYFNGHKLGLRQIYEGLYENDALADQLRPPVQAALERGYTIGYGTRWECNTMMEMTDAELTVVPVAFTEDHERLHYEEWLALRSWQDLEPERTFLLLPGYLVKYYVKLPLQSFGEVIYEDENYTVFGLEDASEWVAYLNAQERW